MLADGRIGQRTGQDGSDEEIRLGRYLALATMDAHGPYYDAVMRGSCFSASLQSAVTFGTALTATAVTFTLFNPQASGKYLVVLETTASLVTLTAAGQVVYAVNAVSGQAAPTGVTEIASGIRNCLLTAGEAPVAKVYTAATLPAAPVAHRTLFSVAATAATGLSPVTLMDPVDGKLILPPGAMVTIQGITIAGSGLISMMWEEVKP